MSIWILLFSIWDVECEASTRDLLSLNIEVLMGLFINSSMADFMRKQFSAVSTATRHSAAREELTILFIFLLCHDSKQ